MVRARLLERNGKPVRGDAVADRIEAEGGDARQARRRAEREFNLSFADALRDDNEVVAGEFWGKTVPAQPELSIEENFAQSLGWELGDDITFDIAGQRFEGRITSLRSIAWESFRPNFFLPAPPGAPDGSPARHNDRHRVGWGKGGEAL